MKLLITERTEKNYENILALIRFSSVIEYERMKYYFSVVCENYKTMRCNVTKNRAIAI